MGVYNLGPYNLALWSTDLGVHLSGLGGSSLGRYILGNDNPFLRMLDLGMHSLNGVVYNLESYSFGRLQSRPWLWDLMVQSLDLRACSLGGYDVGGHNLVLLINCRSLQSGRLLAGRLQYRWRRSDLGVLALALGGCNLGCYSVCGYMSRVMILKQSCCFLICGFNLVQNWGL